MPRRRLEEELTKKQTYRMLPSHIAWLVEEKKNKAQLIRNAIEFYKDNTAIVDAYIKYTKV